MTLVLADRVQETTTTTGTGTLNLAGATSQMQSFLSGIGTGNTTYYCILSGNGIDWEVGQGTVTSGSPNTLSRDTIFTSSNAGSAINLSGVSTVYCTQPATATPTNKVVTPVFTSSSTVFGVTGVFASTASYAIAEGDAYRFHCVIKKTLSSDAADIYITNSAKTRGYRFGCQTDGNQVVSSFNGASFTTLRASGAGTVTNAAGEVIMTGEFAFGASGNWVHQPGAGFPVTNAITNFVGDSFFICFAISPNTSANIIRATFTKIGN